MQNELMRRALQKLGDAQEMGRNPLAVSREEYKKHEFTRATPEDFKREQARAAKMQSPAEEVGPAWPFPEDWGVTHSEPKENTSWP